MFFALSNGRFAFSFHCKAGALLLGKVFFEGNTLFKVIWQMKTPFVHTVRAKVCWMVLSLALECKAGALFFATDVMLLICLLHALIGWTHGRFVFSFECRAGALRLGRWCYEGKTLIFTLRAQIRYGRIFLQCCWGYHRSELIWESDTDTHTHTHTHTRAHTQVELQIRKQITNALWIVNLLCPCSTTLHNEQGVFQCQCSVLQFFEIRAQQQQIDQNKHTPKHFAFNFFKNFLVVLQEVAATWKLLVWTYEFSPLALTTDSFPKDVAKKIAGDWAVFLGLDVIIRILNCLVFGSWFRIAN